MVIDKYTLSKFEYNWIDADKDRFTGEPTRRIFDRLNGYQVLFLINSFAALRERFTLSEALDLEEKIQVNMPVNNQSEKTVFRWLLNM